MKNKKSKNKRGSTNESCHVYNKWCRLQVVYLHSRAGPDTVWLQTAGFNSQKVFAKNAFAIIISMFETINGDSKTG